MDPGEQRGGPSFRDRSLERLVDAVGEAAHFSRACRSSEVNNGADPSLERLGDAVGMEWTCHVHVMHSGLLHAANGNGT